jgi:hypothetical protein
MNDEQREHMDAQEDRQLRGSAAQVGLSMAADRKERTVHNEDFLNELRKTSDLNTEDLNIEGDFPDWFAGIHAVTNRGEQWDQMADLIMMNKRERAVAQRRPGRLLRDRPFLLATMQGADTPGLSAYRQSEIPGSQQHWLDVITERITSDVHDFEMVKTPATSEQQARIYGAAEAAADLWAMSRNALGAESVSTVKTETNVRRQEEEESAKERLGRVME